MFLPTIALFCTGLLCGAAALIVRDVRFVKARDKKRDMRDMVAKR